MYIPIIISMFTFTLLALGVVALFHRFKAKIVAKQLELHQIELKHRQDLLSHSILSAEEERIRIAKDIHDEIGNIFSTLFLSVNGFKPETPAGQERVVISKQLIQSGIDSVRRISHSIVPAELELLGLEQTLENQFQTLRSVSGIRVEFDSGFRLELLNSASALALYRVIQELISNTIKHARASTVTLEISHDLANNRLCLHYADNGIGMDLSKIELKKGIGLKNIDGRLLLLNGISRLETRQGSGFHYHVDIPITQEILLC